MLSERDISRDKSVGDLAREAAWFLTHTFIAFLLLAIALGLISLNHPDVGSATPKYVATALTFLVPMFGSFLLTRIHRNHVASCVWISGVVIFLSLCVWVLDLPTGPGLCDTCGAMEKLWRTLFSFTHGSGFLGGDGVLLGAWIPLAMIGYAVGARLAIDP